MNERIKKLIKQTPLRYSSHQNVEFRKQELEKFAESIVNECIDVCSKVEKQYTEFNNMDVAIGAGTCVDRLEQHFGDEE